MATSSKSKSKSSSGTRSKSSTKARAVKQRKRIQETVGKAQDGKKGSSKKSSGSAKASAGKTRSTTKAGSKARSQTRSKSGATATKPKAGGNGQAKATPPKPSTDLVPSVALEDYQPKVEPQTQGVEDRSHGSTKFGWIGAGQCGGRLVRSFYELGYGKVLALNTAYHDLNDLDLPESQKLLLDIGRKGAGKDMVRGRDAALQYRQKIIHAMEQTFASGVDHVMLAFGAGGGTGSGSVLPLIDTIRSSAKHLQLTDPRRRIGVLATLPTNGEAASPKVGENAWEVMTELCQMASEGQISPLIIIDNEKIARMYPGLTVKEFWPTINSSVAGLFDIFNRLSALSSPYTSFDSVDYQSIMESGGVSIMGITRVDQYQSKFDLSQAMKDNLSRNLLAGGVDLLSAKVAGAIVVGGKKIMAGTTGLQDSINHAFDVLTDLTGQATVHRGIYEDDKDTLRVYTILGGLDTPTERLEELRRIS